MGIVQSYIDFCMKLYKKLGYSKNIGGNIKKAAQNGVRVNFLFYFGLGIIGGIIGGFYVFVGGISTGKSFLIFGGIAISVLSPILAIVLALIVALVVRELNRLLYAFGELVENSAIMAGKITLSSTETEDTDSPEIFFDGYGYRINRGKKSFTKTQKESTDSKKAELDRLKAQGLITEEEYQKKVNSDSATGKSESNLNVENTDSSQEDNSTAKKETAGNKRKAELKRLKDQGLITHEEYLREIRRK